MNEQDKTRENKVIRDEKGRVISGTPNPNGRPKGAGISITTAIKRELEKIPEGHKSSYLDLLVKKILKKGIVDGDQIMIKNIWNYIDGLPKASLELDDKRKDETKDILKKMLDKMNESE